MEWRLVFGGNKLKGVRGQHTQLMHEFEAHEKQKELRADALEIFKALIAARGADHESAKMTKAIELARQLHEGC